MKLLTIPPGLAGKIVKYRPLSELIRLQDLEDSAHSQAWKKKIKSILRRQIFLSHVDNVLSSKASFLSGVPQGAMIGTAPFIDYTHERSSEMGPRVLFKYMTVTKSITLAFSL